MRAVKVHEIGGIEKLVLGKEKIPILKDGEVLIKIKYATVNMVGIYPMDLPQIIGVDGSGEVVEVKGGSGKFKKGDRVVFNKLGAYAEFICVPEGKVAKIPKEITDEMACCSVVNGLTAHYLTRSTYKVCKDDFVLCHAVSGGTGQWIAGICKIMGATVIGTCSSSKISIAKEMGCDYVIDYTKEDFYEKVLEFCKKNGRTGVNVVYDGVGASTYVKSMKCLKERGFLVLFGNASGVVPPIDPLLLTQHGSIFMTRPSLKHHWKGEYENRFKECFQWLIDGKIKVRIHKTFKLEEIKDAHKEIEGRKTKGKILISMEK